MSIDVVKNNFNEAQEVLDAFMNDKTWLAIESAGNCLVDAFKSGNKVLSCGNGGSMCDAMHFAEELSGRFRGDRRPFPAIAISDPSHITCVGNDYGFDEVFARYVEAVGNKGDVLLAISTSGNSVNVLNAAIEAQQKGIKVIALTGKDGGKLAEDCHIEVRVPHSGYADRIQEIHIKVIHSLIHYVEINY
jgi:D-sedoheptulose 7-phosphate isomerase